MSRTMRNEKRKEFHQYKPEDHYDHSGIVYATPKQLKIVKDKEHKHNRRVARKQERAAKRGDYA